MKLRPRRPSLRRVLRGQWFYATDAARANYAWFASVDDLVRRTVADPSVDVVDLGPSGSDAFSALKAKYGPMLESGRKGWQEIAYGGIEDMGCVNWMMFSMIPDGFAKMLKEDDMTIWGMFMDPAIIDLTFPVADEKN